MPGSAIRRRNVPSRDEGADAPWPAFFPITVGSVFFSHRSSFLMSCGSKDSLRRRSAVAVRGTGCRPMASRIAPPSPPGWHRSQRLRGDQHGRACIAAWQAVASHNRPATLAGRRRAAPAPPPWSPCWPVRLHRVHQARRAPARRLSSPSQCSATPCSSDCVREAHSSLSRRRRKRAGTCPTLLGRPPRLR